MIEREDKSFSFFFVRLAFSLSSGCRSRFPDVDRSEKRREQEDTSADATRREQNSNSDVSALSALSRPPPNKTHVSLPPRSPLFNNNTNNSPPPGPPLRDSPGRHHGRRRARHGRGRGLGRRARGRARRVLPLPGHRRLLLLRLRRERQPGLHLFSEFPSSDDGGGGRVEGGDRAGKRREEAPSARFLWARADEGRGARGRAAVQGLRRHRFSAVLPVQGERLHEDVIGKEGRKRRSLLFSFLVYHRCL